jgi:spermidine synthase
VKPKPAVAPTRVEPLLAPALRRFLYLTSAVTGGAIMIVEILGAKMLSPYVGTSHFVWTAQIAVTLVALATGYYVGGRLVDRTARPGRIYGGLLVAAGYLCLTVAVREPVAMECLRFSLPVGSLLASAFLFFVPLSLLAMVGPFFIRVLTQSLANVGGNIGRLSAISTLGSVLGTVLIGYVLIPFLPNSVTMYLTAVTVALLAVIYFLIWGRRTEDKTAAVVAALVAGAVGLGAVRAERWDSKEYDQLFRGNSDFGELQVLQVKHGTRRLYLNDYLTQNTYDAAEKKSASMFTYMLHGLATVYAPKVERVLCIGMGVGIVPMEFYRDGSKVDVVEINPAVLPVAERFFDFDRSKVNVIIADGREYLRLAATNYDALVLDAFLGDSCPSHLMTRESFTAMRRVLKPDGVLVINTFAEYEGERSFFGASLRKTLAGVFPSVRIHAGWNGNTFFVASARTNLSFLHPAPMERVYQGSKGLVEDAYSRIRDADPEAGIVLTDDFNPVEFYDAPNRERTRRSLVEEVRRMTQ